MKGGLKGMKGVNINKTIVKINRQQSHIKRLRAKGLCVHCGKWAGFDHALCELKRDLRQRHNIILSQIKGSGKVYLDLTDDERQQALCDYFEERLKENHEIMEKVLNQRKAIKQRFRRLASIRPVRRGLGEK